MSTSVQAQYEAYPYPARDPAEERERLVLGSPSSLHEINHYLFAGRLYQRMASAGRPFRALVAGGGTGDGTIMLAQHLNEAVAGGHLEAAEITYLDLSSASQAIARERAAVRGLDNITFHQASLFDIGALGLEPLDYIDCCGVLHHLEDPQAGLQALTGQLTEDGGLGLMLYGRLGRRGVYETQAMLRQITEGLALPQAIEVTKKLLASLPPSHWLRRNPMLGDHEKSDAELVDLLLHSCDRAFSVEEIAELLKACDLTLASFIEPAIYEPSAFVNDPAILTPLEGASPLARAAFAEKLVGSLKSHVFYARRGEAPSVARPEGPNSIAVLPRGEGRALAQALRRDGSLKITMGGLSTSLMLPPMAADLLEAIDGKRSLGQIHSGLQTSWPDLSWGDFWSLFRELYGRLGPLNLLLLRQT